MVGMIGEAENDISGYWRIYTVSSHNLLKACSREPKERYETFSNLGDYHHYLLISLPLSSLSRQELKELSDKERKEFDRLLKFETSFAKLRAYRGYAGIETHQDVHR